MNSQSYWNDSVPPFITDGSLYNQDTYWGRFSHFLSIIDPRLLLVNSERLATSQKLLHEFKKFSNTNGYIRDDAALWEAQRIVDSAVNPATGEVIHPIARMCAFIPSSVPITLGMLTMTSTPAILGLQWINQSYNAIFNYSHRSKPSKDKAQILKAYALATGTSCGLALGLSRIAKNIKPPWLISTVAVMAAGSANVAFTRGNEIRDGVNVYNEKGDVIGTSKIAGKYAVGYTILSRSILLPIPLMVLPGYMSECIRKSFFKSGIGRRQRLVIDIGCIILAQSIALPACIAAFPQTLKVKRSDLEPEFLKGGDDDYVFIKKGV
jgi:tricarboxylate carrier